MTYTNYNSISHYMSQIRDCKPLTFDEEQALAREYHESGSKLAEQKLVRSHLKLVVKIAHSYSGYGLPLTELIQEGNIGLLNSLKRFDPDTGFRLSTYASWWIRAGIQEYVLQSFSMIKIGTTAAQKKLFFNLKKLKSKMNQMEDSISPQAVSDIAEALGVKEKEVLEMNIRMSKNIQSLNATFGDESTTEVGDFLVDDTPNQEELFCTKQQYSAKNAMLREAMSSLKSREQDIIRSRHLKDKAETLESLGIRYDVSKERIRQIEEIALAKIKSDVIRKAKATPLY
ncbi:MAG: sigma-70 family RNA polymerase sigma factor [Proteobacteria bacterium]|nr:sigma-70 family RNA polymerase sigma factor [Pseudomonadota bacterium]